MAQIEGRVVDHVGWARREIAVGTETLAIAGVGGGLISADARGMRLVEELTRCAEQSMRARGHLGFGYLGCREQVVPFYESCGWKRILPREKSISRDGEFIVGEPDPPILILPIASLEPWPEGDVDLRGRAWQSLTAVGPRCRKSVECGFALSPLEAHRQFFPDTLWSLE